MVVEKRGLNRLSSPIYLAQAASCGLATDAQSWFMNPCLSTVTWMRFAYTRCAYTPRKILKDALGEVRRKMGDLFTFYC